MYIEAQQWSNRSASSIRFCSWQLCPWSRSKTITVLGKFDSVLKGFVSPNIAVVKLWSHHCTFCLLKLLRFHSTRYATQYNYYRIQARTNYSKFSFKFFTSKLWESIPVSLKLLPPNSFRAHYKLHLLSKQQRNDITLRQLESQIYLYCSVITATSSKALLLWLLCTHWQCFSSCYY